MRAVVQRVSRASVRVEGATVAEIGPGLLVLLGVARGDTEQGADWLADKVGALRIFPDSAGAANVLPMDQLRSRYFIRLTAKDEPGVMAQVSQALGQHGISLSAILQRENEESKPVPVVITTHLAQEGAVRRALAQIDALPTIVAPTVCLRVVDPPKEFSHA